MITTSTMTTLTSTTGLSKSYLAYKEVRSTSIKISLICSVGTVNGIDSVYKSILTNNIPNYLDGCGESIIYYENVEMYVDKQGKYEFVLNSTEEVSIHVYKDYFNPTNLLGELLLRHLTGCNICQVKFTINLQSNRTYQVTIITPTEHPKVPFLITSTGPSKISFNRRG